MNRIDTSFAVDPSIQQPFTVRSLDFLQDANKEMVNAICKSLVSRSGYIYNGSVPYLMFSGSGSRYVFFNDELYFMQPPSGGDNIAVLFATTPDPNADPLIFTDNVARNVHNQRIIDPQNGTLGTGLFDLVDIIDINTDSVVTPALINSWTNTFGGVPQYFKNKNQVILSGTLTKLGSGSGDFFILPTGYAPLTDRYIPVSTYNGTSYISNVIIVSTSGNIGLLVTSGTNVNVFLDGLSFSL